MATIPRINGTATEKIEWLRRNTSVRLSHPVGAEGLVISVGESIQNGQDVNVVLSPDGGWWIEHET